MTAHLPAPGTCETHVSNDVARFRIVNDMRSLEAGGAALRAYLASRGIDERATFWTDLAFEELATNVMHHAFQGRAASAHPIDVEIAVAPGEVVLVIEDDGPAFDPTALPAQPAPKSLEAARIGGLGIPFVRAAARQLEYRRDDGRNRVTVHLARSL